MIIYITLIFILWYFEYNSLSKTKQFTLKHGSTRIRNTYQIMKRKKETQFSPKNIILGVWRRVPFGQLQTRLHLGPSRHPPCYAPLSKPFVQGSPVKSMLKNARAWSWQNGATIKPNQVLKKWCLWKKKTLYFRTPLEKIKIWNDHSFKKVIQKNTKREKCLHQKGENGENPQHGSAPMA